MWHNRVGTLGVSVGFWHPPPLHFYYNFLHHLSLGQGDAPFRVSIAPELFSITWRQEVSPFGHDSLVLSLCVFSWEILIRREVAFVAHRGQCVRAYAKLPRWGWSGSCPSQGEHGRKYSVRSVVKSLGLICGTHTTTV